MLIKLDKTKMELNIICGILEKYKPSKEIKQVYKNTEELRVKMDKFMNEEVLPKLKEIEELIAKENAKYVL